MSYKIEKLSEAVAQEQPATYVVTTYKNAVDKEGNTVEVVDRTNRITKEQLESEKSNLQSKIDAIAEQIIIIDDLNS